MSDQTYKADNGKLRYDLITPEMMEALATILTYGVEKYGEPRSYLKCDDFENRYAGAEMRHFDAWRRGEEADAESGFNPLWHAFATLAILVDGDAVKKAKKSEFMIQVDEILGDKPWPFDFSDCTLLNGYNITSTSKFTPKTAEEIIADIMELKDMSSPSVSFGYRMRPRSDK